MKTTKDMIRAFNRLAKSFNVKMIDADSFKGSKAQLLTLTAEMTSDPNPLPLLEAEFAKIETHHKEEAATLKATEKKVKAMTPKTTIKKTSPALTGDELKAALENKPINKAETLVAVGAYETETEAMIKTGHTTHGKTKPAAPATPAKAKPTTKAKPAADASSEVAIAAAELKLSPKVLRAKLRKLGMNAPYPKAAVIVKRIKG